MRLKRGVGSRGHLEPWDLGNKSASYPGLNAKALDGVKLRCIFAKKPLCLQCEYTVGRQA